MFQEHLDCLMDATTIKDFSEEVIKAKKEYFSKIGEVFEDDRSFESKMVSFTEWYCFDRVSEKNNKSPLEHFIDINSPMWSKEDIDIYTGFCNNIHSIFYFKKIKKEKFLIVNLLDSKKILVNQGNLKIYFEKDDVFEARLIPFKNEYYFTGSFCFHPKELYGKIRKELKKRAKNKSERLEFLFLLSAMSLKLERSRQISMKDIYKI